MEFWNNLSPRLRVVFVIFLAAVFLAVGFIYYPSYLKNAVYHSSQDIVLHNEPTQISVYVTGAVKSPGVYTLPHGSRVKDLLKIAGTAKNWDPEEINLARRLEDEDMIVVPRMNSPGKQKSEETAFESHPVKTKLKSDEKVSVNKGTLADLQALPGVGPGMAKRILDYRLAHGSFGSVEDLKDVPGLGDKKFERMKPYLRL